jgi:hydroxypyruvate isomerase
MPIRQSFSWWCFANKGTPEEPLLSGARAIGYEAVELIGEEFWPQARDLGLTISSTGGHGTIAQGCNRAENAGRIREELLFNIDKAVKWKIPVLICFSGNREGLDDEAGLKRCVETLAPVVRVAEQAGVVLAMELLNSRVDHKDYQCDRTSWGSRLCREIGSPSFKLLYDIYHMQIMEGDVIRTIGDHHTCIAHYHTAGCPGRGPMDEDQELNYSAIYRAIQATGYQGFIGHEFLPKGNPLEELDRAFHQCKQALSSPAR